MITEADYILIEQYLDGQLNVEQQHIVEQRASSDLGFAHELATHKQMRTWLVGEMQKDAILAEIEKQNSIHFVEEKKQKSGISLHWRWMATAVAASLALLLYIFWPNQLEKHEELYEQYATHAPLSLTVRSASDAGAQAERSFNSQHYAEATQALVKLSEQQPEDLRLQLYLAICYLETNQITKAQAILQPISTGESVWASEAQWYLAMAFLKEGNNVACKDALKRVASQDARYAQAQKLLADLD